MVLNNNDGKRPSKVVKLVDKRGVGPRYKSDLETQLTNVRDLRTPVNGKFRVLEVDRWDDSSTLAGEVDSEQAAFDLANKLTTSNPHYASDPSVSVVWYVYDPDGAYLGQGCKIESECEDRAPDSRLID